MPTLLSAVAGFAFQAQHSREPQQLEDLLRQIVDASDRAINLHRQFHILRLHGGIEPEILGPFATEEDRDNQAIALRKENDEDVILAVDGPGQSIRIDAYSAGFLNQE